ncbi:hypothetical protein ZWY2020_036363 [Hordeum vulgare]|nr:hypothetical protein ZWY2020_036363 [Hordeum vulgare]
MSDPITNIAIHEKLVVVPEIHPCHEQENPLMFSTTGPLSVRVLHHRGRLAAAGELGHALEAVRWGVDYLAKAHARPDVLYVNVYDGDSDHLFQFAKNHRGLYQNNIPSSKNFYSSSGDEDELLWAAVWLYIATGDHEYKAYISGASNVGRVRQSLAWDDKFVGVQALVAKVMSKS